MPEINITHGGKARAFSVDRVHRINRGEEDKALEAMRKDGADNIVFKSDQGDLYIASFVGRAKHAEINDRVAIDKASRVAFQGVKGTLMGFDNENNTLGESIRRGGVAGAVAGGVLGVAGIGLAVLKLGMVALNPLAAVGIIGGLGLAGLVIGSLFRKKPDYDKLDGHTGGMELA